jgi:hypothetical protein
MHHQIIAVAGDFFHLAGLSPIQLVATARNFSDAYAPLPHDWNTKLFPADFLYALEAFPLLALDAVSPQENSGDCDQRNSGQDRVLEPVRRCLPEFSILVLHGAQRLP